MGKMKNISVPIMAVDFEGSRELGIVEYGVAEFFAGRLECAYTRICRPRVAIRSREAAFFDISDSEARAEMSFSQDLPKFTELRRRGVFAAHNAAVEDSLLRAEAPTPSFVRDFFSGETCATWGPWLDSCAFCRNIYPSIKSAKLSDVIGALGLEEELDSLAEKFCPKGRRKWHCALYDAIACGLIYVYTCSLDGFENVSLRWLGKYSGVDDADQQGLKF